MSSPNGPRDAVLSRQRVAIEVGTSAQAVVSSMWLGHRVAPLDAVHALLARHGVEPSRRPEAHSTDSSMLTLTVDEGCEVLVHRVGLRYRLDGEDAERLEHVQQLRADQGHRMPLAAPGDLIAEGIADHASDGIHAGYGGPLDPIRIQRLAGYAVLNDGERVLLTRLRRLRRWSLPGGGIDFGERPDDGLRREVFEECGLAASELRLFGAGTACWTGHAPDGRLEDFQSVYLLYTATVPADVAPQVIEVDGSTDEVAWVAHRDAVDPQRCELTSAAREGLRWAGIGRS